MATRTSRMRTSPRRSTKRAAEKGLVLLSCGLYGNVIRFLVPLTASDAIVREGLGIVAESLRELTAASLKSAVNS